MFRMLIRTILKKSAHIDEIHEADDGIGALELLDDHRFDLVITDLNMPRMGGLDLIDHIRQHPRNRFAKICVISGDDANRERRQARQRGANAFVIKPIDRQQLLDTVNGLLQ